MRGGETRGGRRGRQGEEGELLITPTLIHSLSPIEKTFFGIWVMSCLPAYILLFTYTYRKSIWLRTFFSFSPATFHNFSFNESNNNLKIECLECSSLFFFGNLHIPDFCLWINFVFGMTWNDWELSGLS